MRSADDWLDEKRLNAVSHIRNIALLAHKAVEAE